MDNIISFVASNWEGIAAVVVAVLYLGEKVAKLTKTDKDDKIVEVVESTLERFGVKKPEAK